jgi:hypothetical protein
VLGRVLSAGYQVGQKILSNDQTTWFENTPRLVKGQLWQDLESDIGLYGIKEKAQIRLNSLDTLVSRPASCLKEVMESCLKLNPASRSNFAGLVKMIFSLQSNLGLKSVRKFPPELL